MKGRALRARRVAAGIRQTDLARALGHTPMWIYLQERRLDAPRPDFQARYLDAVRTLAVAAQIRTRTVPAVRRELQRALDALGAR